MAYTHFTGDSLKEKLSNVRDHCSGHVIVLMSIDDKLHIVLGHHSFYDALATFGGFSQEGETLMETILRRSSEESLDSIVDKSTMEDLLMNSIAMITRKSAKGRHYSVFVKVSGDFSEMKEQFTQASSKPDLTEGQKENDYLALVPLANITSDDQTKDFEGNPVNIRDVTLDGYKWLHNAIRQGTISV